MQTRCSDLVFAVRDNSIVILFYDTGSKQPEVAVYMSSISTDCVMTILTVNTGSSSVRLGLFDQTPKGLTNVEERHIKTAEAANSL